MKKILFFLLLSQCCFAQQFQWAKHAGGSTGDDIGYGICVDKAQNSYVTGSMDSTFAWHDSLNQTHHYSNFYLSKYDPSGTVLWTQRAGGINNSLGIHIANDNNANVFVVGQFMDTAYKHHVFIGNDTLIGTALRELFLVSYDSTGVMRWINKIIGVNANITTTGITTDAYGNTYITGQFDGTAKFDTMTVYSSGNGDFYLAKYNSAGKAVWVRNGADYGAGLAYSSSSGNIYVAGTYINTATFGITTLTSVTNSYDIFLASCDTSGNWLWAKSAGGPNDDAVSGITVDTLGNFYIAGNITDSTSTYFGTDTVTGYYNNDLYLAKYNSNGTLLWAKNAGGSGVDDVNGITSDYGGNVYLAGDFQGAATFGSHSFNAVGYDVFVSKYDPSGNVLGSERAGGPSDDFAYSVAVDNMGELYITGSFKDTSTFGSIKLVSAGGADIFVAKTGMDVGINEVKTSGNNSFNVYPNPSTGLLTVNYSSKESTSLNVRLTNVEGQVIYSEQKQLNGIYNQNFDFSSLAKGIYFLEIITNKETLVKKIILN